MASGAMKVSLMQSNTDALDKKDTKLEKVLLGSANLALAALPAAHDGLKKATLVYTAKSLSLLGSDEMIKSRLLRLAADREAIEEARREAGALVTLAAATAAQVEVAEARLRAELGL
jgi:hypothetical protein